MSATRYIARERQKQELRRERDALVLNLASALGEQGLADRLGVTRPVVDKLLADARERIHARAPSQEGQEIAARRPGADRDRWAEADANYQALGSSPALSDRRRTAPSTSTPTH